MPWVLAALILFAAWSAALAVWNFAKAKHEDRTDARSAHPGDLEGCLYTLRALLCHFKSLSQAEPSDVRITIHALREEQLEQVVPYVGDSRRDRGVGRKMSARSGIAGRVCRTRQPATVHLPSDISREDYLKILVNEGSFTQSEAERVSEGRLSSMAVPLFGDGDQVIGCVYADSPSLEYFDTETFNLVLVATAEIAKFIDIRYNRR